RAVALVPLDGLQKLGATLLEASRAAATPEREADEALALEVATALLFAEQMFDRGLRQVDDLDERAAELAARVRQCAASAEALPAMPGWMLELGRTAQERITMSAFVAESRSTLRTIEQGLDTFFRDPSQSAGLPAALRQLRQVAGALQLLGQEQAG